MVAHAITFENSSCFPVVSTKFYIVNLVLISCHLFVGDSILDIEPVVRETQN